MGGIYKQVGVYTPRASSLLQPPSPNLLRLRYGENSKQTNRILKKFAVSLLYCNDASGPSILHPALIKKIIIFSHCRTGTSPYICGMENLKDILNNRLKKTKLNKKWYPFDYHGTKGEIRIISVHDVDSYLEKISGVGYNIEVKITAVPETWRGRYMLRDPKYRNNEIRNIFKWGEGGFIGLSMMRFLGADCSYNTIKTIKLKPRV